MRTSLLSRSVVAVASLALAAAALAAAAPANAASTSAAATPAGVTREAVLTAAGGSRLVDPPTDPSYGTALRAIVNRGCPVDYDGGEMLGSYDAYPADTPGNADGVIIVAEIFNYVEEVGRECVVGAVAATEPGFTLTGNGSLTVASRGEDTDDSTPTTVGLPLAGDVATVAFSATQDLQVTDFQLSASGSSVKVTKATTSSKVKDKKTKAEKKAAKKKYDKRLKAAKKSYTKALDKAGKSKSKKAAAKKAYAKKKASAKTAYKNAIAGHKIVTKTISTTDSRPFSFTAAQPVL